MPPASTSTGDACPQGEPCTLAYAIGGAAAGDEIVVTAGDYTVGSAIVSPAFVDGLVVRGAVGGPAAPRIVFGASGVLALGGAGSAVRDLRFEGGSSAGTRVSAGTLERVYVHGASGTACQAKQTVESVCWSEAGAGLRVRLGAGEVRNVTAYGGTYGIEAVEDSTNGGGAHVVNAIARGNAADLRVFAASGGIGAVITVEHSNYVDELEEGTGTRAVNPGAGNQSADPLLVSPATGDFHQTLESPTRDKGVAATGTDLDGHPRPLGPGTDIGADEGLVAPTAATGAAVEVTPTGATLTGTVAGGGAPATYRFEYGVTPVFGFATADATAADGAVSARVEGLEPGTTYHYRLAASNPLTTSFGPTLTLATPIPPDLDAPFLSGLALTRKRFSVGSAFTPLSAAARGTVLSFRVSEAGRTLIRVQRRLPGRRARGRCVAPGKAPSGARRCARWKLRAPLERSAVAGRNEVPFSGRIGTRGLSKRLAVGRYRFRVVAVDAAGNPSEPATIAFRIVR